MEHTMKQTLICVAFVLGAIFPAAAQQTKPTVKIGFLSLADQKTYLETLLPNEKPGKKDFMLIKPYIVAAQQITSNDGVACSTGSSTYADPNGTEWTSYGSTVCRDIVHSGDASVLAISNPQKPGSGYLLFVSCSGAHQVNQARLAVATYGIGNIFARSKYCIMQEPGRIGSMVLAENKPGKFTIDVGTVEHLGDKPKLSTFVVDEVRTADLVQ